MRAGIMPYTFDDVLRATYRAVVSLEYWLRVAVVDFYGFKEHDRHDIANGIALALTTGACPCGRANCRRQHNLAAKPRGMSLQRFVTRAVHGPMKITADKLRANSIEQGMAFDSFRVYYDLIVVWAEFKRCHECGDEYEGGKCVRPECRAPFSPYTTMLIRRRWIVIKGVYVAVRRWRCGRGADMHFYDLNHDRCPLANCPNGHPPRSQRPITLWVRDVFAGRMVPHAPAPPRLLAAIDEGMRQALAQLSEDLRTALSDEFGDDLVPMAEGLFDKPPAFLSDEDFRKIRKTLINVLEQYGIDEDTTNDWR